VGSVASAFVGFALAFVGTLVASVVVASLLLAARPHEPVDRVIASLGGVVAGGVASAVMLVAVALLAATGPRAASLGLVRGRASGPATLIMLIGVLALGQALESLSLVVGVGSRGAVETMRRALVALGAGEVVLAVLVIGVAAGFGEELFFRGFMQRELRRHWPAWWAITAAAACFGTLHLDWVHGALAFVLGLYLGFIAERSESVVPAIVCHVVNNSAAVVLTAAFGTVTHVWTNLGLVIVMSLIFAGALYLLMAILPPRPAARGVGATSPGRVG
jgi:membrane protease YdiL (CAAX protease family)